MSHSLSAIPISRPAFAGNSKSRLTAATTLAQDTSSADKYKEAKELMKKARALLREFLKDNPTGDDAYFANIQLKALDNLIVTDIPIPFVLLRNAIEWRILKVDVQEVYTKVKIQLHNANETQDSSFSRFNVYPLALIANGGKFYAMKQDYIQLPSGVSADGLSWFLQGGQTVTMDLYFDPLDEGVTDGQIKYQFQNEATPVKFSLLNKNQKPGDK